MSLIRVLLESVFPNLVNSPYDAESEETDKYNCIAWAAGDTDKWWWPHPNPNVTYWPASVPRILHRDYFVEAFATENYEECGTDFSLEAEYEKVALYLDQTGEPKHMARQLQTGIWTSKVGESWDIVHHSLEGMQGDRYGHPVLAMRRPWRTV